MATSESGSKPSRVLWNPERPIEQKSIDVLITEMDNICRDAPRNDHATTSTKFMATRSEFFRGVWNRDEHARFMAAMTRTLESIHATLPFGITIDGPS